MPWGGASGAPAHIHAGDLLAVDRVLDEVIVNPDSSTSTVAAFSRRLAEQHVLDAKHAERKHLPAITRNGFRAEVTANFGTPGEAEPAVEAGADGIGLFRAEYLFYGSRQTALRG
jgi:phosphotransferase system enzyme I (PtsI)